ncbi:ribbon-helix-helix protein, CopG family [Streptomyces bottropensis]|uniref:ribbon-helix-helix protein, CopG family n=1 Tax=Streptomyces bottropensis TaxID=42235 RepID=UPI0036ABC4AA
MSEKKMKRTNVYADPEDLEAIKEGAERLGISEAELIRRGIQLAAASVRTWDTPAVRQRFRGSGKTVSRGDIHAAVAGSSSDDVVHAAPSEEHPLVSPADRLPGRPDPEPRHLLVGQAGAGKSHLAAVIAAALGRDANAAVWLRTRQILDPHTEADRRALRNLAAALHSAGEANDAIDAARRAQRETLWRWVFSAAAVTEPAKANEDEVDAAIRLIFEAAGEESQA